MAIAFYAEDTKLPAIKKRAVGNWVKAVSYTHLRAHETVYQPRYGED